MSFDSARTVRVARRFPQSAERVFDAWLNPRMASRFLFATETGTMVRAELDPRVGGRFTFVDRRDGEDVEHVGEYLEIDRPRRLVFTFGVPKFSAEMTRVTLEFLPAGSGCELTLTHEGVLPDYQERTAGGWTKILGGAEQTIRDDEAAAGKRIGPRTLRFERVFPGPVERVWEYLADSEKRGLWLASGELPAEVGAEFTWYFAHDTLSPFLAPRPAKFKDLPEKVESKHRLLRYEPPRCLGISWGEGEAASMVLFELTAEGERTRLSITHEKLADRNEMVDVSGGWHSHLDVLEYRLNERTPPPFWLLFGDIEGRYQREYPAEPGMTNDE
jgi:uncharacterized protein YndB with AHSA1/START domain